MPVVVGVRFVRVLDNAQPWSKKSYKSVCRLAPRWDVELVNEDGSLEHTIAAYRNSGRYRDAYVLDEKRIMKMAPITANSDHNEQEADIHRRVGSVTDFKWAPDVFGCGRTRVCDMTFSWLIVERATWAVSDFMLHSKAFANAGDDG
jgi:hypothetical protein